MAFARRTFATRVLVAGKLTPILMRWHRREQLVMKLDLCGQRQTKQPQNVCFDFRRIFNPYPSSRRICGLKGSTYLVPGTFDGKYCAEIVHFSEFCGNDLLSKESKPTSKKSITYASNASAASYVMFRATTRITYLPRQSAPSSPTLRTLPFKRKRWPR